MTEAKKCIGKICAHLL